VHIGVICATYGEPERNSFAEQWIYSYRILKGLTRKIAKIPRPMLPIIATARARVRVRLWHEHQFASPLEHLHEETVTSIGAELRRRRINNITVAAAYEFRRPDMAAIMPKLRAQGCDSLIIVPMYIADGDFTNGMTRWAVNSALSRGAWPSGNLTYCTLADDPPTTDRLAATLANHCLSSMASRGIASPAKDWALMLAAHGTVITAPPGVDNGLVHAAKDLIRLKAILKPHLGLVRLGWLNHTRGGKWTTPAVLDALNRVQSRGFKKLVYFPWGFTTDNAETALEGRIAVHDLTTPFERVEHLECMNTQQSFVNLIADRLCDHLKGAALTVAAASHVA
jgi:protoheme ferro-lyase